LETNVRAQKEGFHLIDWLKAARDIPPPSPTCELPMTVAASVPDMNSDCRLKFESV
jgi:hypothetical protein